MGGRKEGMERERAHASEHMRFAHSPRDIGALGAQLDLLKKRALSSCLSRCRCLGVLLWLQRCVLEHVSEEQVHASNCLETERQRAHEVGAGEVRACEGGRRCICKTTGEGAANNFEYGACMFWRAAPKSKSQEWRESKKTRV